MSPLPPITTIFMANLLVCRPQVGAEFVTAVSFATRAISAAERCGSAAASSAIRCNRLLGSCEDLPIWMSVNIALPKPVQAPLGSRPDGLAHKRRHSAPRRSEENDERVERSDSRFVVGAIRLQRFSYLARAL